MSIAKTTEPPFNTPFEDEQGNITRAWRTWIDSVYKYLNQEQVALTDASAISGSPGEDDHNALVAKINAIHDNLEAI